MVAALPTPRAKPAKFIKKGTATTKSHRFEPFSQRVAKLKIDPIHRVRRPSFGESSDVTSSYFRSALDHWSELNMSESFVQFCRQVSPLSESLAQILYHEEKIMSLLVEFIERRDQNSMEPLLSLTAQFARDLGVRFEKHFASTVTLVASVAAIHPDIEVIEWSFSCLAWVFKFLSRLLVPDLRQLLGIMTPYLGKERQKSFVTRFAAESMSFLIRKAGLTYYRDKMPLERAVSFLFDDLATSAADSKKINTYKEGLMAMFSDSIYGTNGGLYSNGIDILNCIFDNASRGDELRSTLALEVTCGVLVNICHRTSADTFAPVIDATCSYIRSHLEGPGDHQPDSCCRLILLCAGTRKGTRVKDWKIIYQTLLFLLQKASSSVQTFENGLPMILTAAAYALQTSPMDDILPFMRPLMEAITSERLSKYFIPFCITFSEYGSERFHSIVLPHFQRFINSSWSEGEYQLCLALLRLSQAGCVTSELGRPGRITCPATWKSRMGNFIKNPVISESDVALLNLYSKLPKIISLSTAPSLIPDMTITLRDRLLHALKDDASGHLIKTKFFFGQGYKTYVDLAVQSGDVDSTSWRSVKGSTVKYSRLQPFLEATLAYIRAYPESIGPDDSGLEDIAFSLIANLAGPSHPLRLLSLKILRELAIRTRRDPSPIGLAIEVEESPLTIQTSRVLSMQVRKLSILYPEATSDKWMVTLIPSFCFGLFSKRLASLWDDSAAALRAISTHQEGEKLVSDMATQWLKQEGPHASLEDEEGDEADDNSDSYGSSDFQCFNLTKIENILSANFKNPEQPDAAAMRILENDHMSLQAIPNSSKTHALRIFNAAPSIAEKHSRQIVPVFLSWVVHADEGGSTLATDEQLSIGDEYIRLNLKDQLLFLALFAQFVNPKVIYRAAEVHTALLGLLCNGNSDIQRSALKAIFTWKSPSILPYSDNLLNILDEARFREELSVFVRIGGDDCTIEEAHRKELIPILLRLLYGRMVSKAGASSGHGGQSARRKAILRTLSHLPKADFEAFLQIAFGPLRKCQVIQDGLVNEGVLGRELANTRRQTGLLNMIESVFEALRNHMALYVESSMNVILYCLIRACRGLQKMQLNEPTDAETSRALTTLRGIRQTCIRCLELVFSISLDRDWAPYVRVIYDEVISPRMENFATETAQGISGLLRLFHTWATTPRSAFYLSVYDNSVLLKTVDILGVSSARDEVKIYVLDEILAPIIDLSSRPNLQEQDDNTTGFSSDRVRTEVLSPFIEHTLSHLGRLLKRGPSRPLLVSAVQTLSILAPCVESSQETSSLISITTYLLRQPPNRVSPKTKSGLLRILEHFLPLYDPKEDHNLSQEVFEAVSSMFDYFKDSKNRETLSRAFTAFANWDLDLREVAVMCEDLNSMSARKLGVDYERRLQAFQKLNEGLWKMLSAKHWRPLLFNMLYYVKDEEELAVRSSASFGLRRFMESAALHGAERDGFGSLVENILLPALQAGVRQNSELIRSEFVAALGYFVKLNPTEPVVCDMHVLLVGDDEEASFFNNILHIQQHRRLRALRRLAASAAEGRLQSSNISNFFIPLIEHFVFDDETDESAHNLTAEAVASIGVLAEWLDWSRFRANFRRYRSYMQSKPNLEKNILRLLGRMSDALTNAMTQISQPGDKSQDAMNGVEPPAMTKSVLAQSIPSTDKVAVELTTHFMPFLTNFIHQKEESQMSIRLPAAVTTVKLLKLLPEQDMAIRLPPVLSDVCNILKSRAQDSRDTARKALNDIAMLLGPMYFGYMLKELRNTLARGYQLHVLSFTVHSMLVSTTDHFKQGELDYCLSTLVSVVMDDIFGVAGQEKDAEEYVSKMKEVKSSKSFDSMELLAKNSTVENLAKLIRPLQGLLREKLSSNIIRKVDELLRRIGVGLLRNPGAENCSLLVFCYEVIKESYEVPAQNESAASLPVPENFYLVNLQAPRRDEKRASTSSYVYKLTRFALDILRSVLGKYDSLLTPGNLSGFLPIIGDALVQAHEEVKISALRLLSTIVKLPLAEIDNNSPVYLAEAVKVIKEAPSANSEAAQAALKLIAAMLRERKDTRLRDGHLTYLLQRLALDIEEPDRQGITFNFVRAVMSRKFVVPEIYELADSIASMMVTNQTRSARDLARGVYIHFLIEYPQSKSRWTKQLGFLAKNLEYKHADGRQSVMEALHMILSKTGPELSQDVIATVFLPVVVVMTNDEAPECREMAGALLGELYSRADRERAKSILSPVRSWLENEDNTLLRNAGLQTMRIYFEVEETEKGKEARFVMGILPSIIQPILGDDLCRNPEMLYYALQLLTKLCKAIPSVAMSKNYSTVWGYVRECLFYPHAWVKTCATNLIGTWLADLARKNAETGYNSIPLIGTWGLALDRDAMIQLTRASVRCLHTPGISEELAMQSVRNTIFLGRCGAQSRLGLPVLPKDIEPDDSGNEEESDREINGDSGRAPKPVIQYIFGQISSVLRREILSARAESLIPKTASLSLFAALCKHLDTIQIIPSLPKILLPLQHLTDSSIPAPRASDEKFQNAYKGLTASCHETLDLIQKKLGTTEYVIQMAKVQENIKERRESRRTKRRIEAVTEPEKHGREKAKRNERKREKRRDKGLEYRAKRRGW